MAPLLDPDFFFIFAGVTPPGGVPLLIGVSPALLTEQGPQRDSEKDSGSVCPCGFWGVESVSAEVSVHEVFLLNKAAADGYVLSSV